MKKLMSWGCVAILLAWAGSAGAQSTQEPLVIGVPVPLTGPLATGGQLVAAGIKLAADDINKDGGILGRQIKLLVEDTKSEANTSAAVATKMVTLDKVYAVIGGFGSTPDFAMLQSIKRYQPIFIHPSSGSVKLEAAFGDQPWYFHAYIWDYHRQKGVTKFLESIEPKPKTIAIAYEDGLNGSDAAKFAEQYIAKAGIEIVMREPFKTGAADFSPIISRVKRLQPDIFYVNGYAGDAIKMVNQLREFNVKPKLALFVSSGEKREDFGDAGIDVAFIQEWTESLKTPGNADLVKRFSQTFPELNPPRPSMFLGYVSLKTLAESIAAAKTFDRDPVLRELSTRKFSTPFGEVNYGTSDGGAIHQLLNENSEIVVQYRAKGMEVVWPASKATGALVYPMK
jgi:branched-chain amino acid transport system substrate-binding protein